MQDILKHIRESLKVYYEESEAVSISRYIIEDITGLPLFTILADKSKQITAEQRTSINKIISRLQNFEPLQYILGYTEFFGLAFNTKQGVLIPRPETEELVDLIIKEYQNNKPSILDIGTGSGCIAISLAKNIKDSEIEAWDVSAEALKIAQSNALKNETVVNFELVNVLTDIISGKKFDVIVSNPPYVLESEKISIEKHVLDFEPHLALFVPDNKALMFYERIADIAKNILNPNGMLYFEINCIKGMETVEMLKGKGFINIRLIQDLSGKDRIVAAQLAN